MIVYVADKRQFLAPKGPAADNPLLKFYSRRILADFNLKSPLRRGPEPACSAVLTTERRGRLTLKSVETNAETYVKTAAEIGVGGRF